MTWKNKYWHEESERLKDVPMWQNYRMLTIVMLAVIGVVVFIIFR